LFHDSVICKHFHLNLGTHSMSSKIQMKVFAYHRVMKQQDGKYVNVMRHVSHLENILMAY